MSTILRSRLAPTPSGFLHLGNAFNFLLTEALTRRAQGILRLRIDDLDATRIRPAYLEDVFETLDWLGIDPEEGPSGVADHTAHYSQVARMDHYSGMLDALSATNAVFACTCSRAEVARNSSDGQYSGACRDKGLPLHTPGAAWRFRTEAHDIISWIDGVTGVHSIALHRHLRDFIIRRSDGLPAYHIASLCDDVTYGINLIVRGEDLLHSTAAQLRLAGVLGLTTFLQCRFYHHPLLIDNGGEKLSKSAGSESLKALRRAGVSGVDIRSGATKWYRAFLPTLN